MSRIEELGSGVFQEQDEQETQFYLPNQSVDIANLTPAAIITLGSPTGTVIDFAGPIAPAGYLLCDGSAVSRTTFSNLFTAIGTAWGNGDGSTTFNIPDLRGVFTRGVDGGAGNDPDSFTRIAIHPGGNVGDAVGSFQSDGISSHQHETDLTDATHANFGFGATTIPGLDNGGATRTGLGHLTQATGGSETRPKNVYVNKCIKI